MILGFSSPRRGVTVVVAVVVAMLAAATGTGRAASTRVTTLAELEAAIAQAQPGDTITVASGNYSGAISVGRAGAAAAGITIASETIGGAVISGGTFRLTGTAAYVTVRGFRFNGVSLVMDLGSHHCHVTRNHFEVGTASRAVHVQGNDQELSFNSFQNKSSAGSMVQLDASGRSHAGTQRTFIHHNLFLNHTFGGGNGGECIATWGQVTRVEHNLFEQCNGDPEIITVKASDGFYRFNTFRGSTRGQLVLRFARNVVVEGNYLLGTRGMRLYGPDHKIINNYLENNNGTAMMISHGAADGTYLQIQRMLIAHNTIINDAVTGRSGDLPPQGVVFANNIIHKTSGPALTEGANWSGTRYEGNIVSGGATLGAIGEGGGRAVDAQLTKDASGISRIGAGSPAVNAGVGMHGVMEDIDGQPRAGGADVGADEFSSAPILHRPLTRNDVGPMATGMPAPPSGDAGVTPPGGDGGGPMADAGPARDGGGHADGRGVTADGAGAGAGGSGGGAGAGGAGGAGGGAAGQGGPAGAGGDPGSGGSDPGVGGRSGSPAPAAGCGCRVAGGRGAAAPGMAVVLLGAVVAHRRRRPGR
jgi:MYXO-CTERM domain-containing protein